MKKGKNLYILISWILVLICMGVIFLLSAQVAEESQELSDSFIDKLLAFLGVELSSDFIRTMAHMLEFMGLSLLVFNAVYSTWEINLTPIIAFLGTVLYAITDEIHQLFVPGRAFQFSDILVDSAGALIGVTVSAVILKIILKKRGNINGNT